MFYFISYLGCIKVYYNILLSTRCQHVGQLVHGQHELQGHLLHGQHEHWVKLLHGTVVQGRVKVVS
jgi:hypothetical protein